MGNFKSEMNQLLKDKEKEEKNNKRKYAAPLPENLVVEYGTGVYNKMTEWLRKEIEKKRYYKPNWHSSYRYKVIFTYDIKLCDKPEQNHLFFDRSDNVFFPVNEYLYISVGEDGWEIGCKNTKHIEQVFSYAEKLLRNEGLEVDRKGCFGVYLPCDRNGRFE